MRTVSLIAANYLRDQRWPLIGSFGYAVAMIAGFGLVGSTPARSDLAFLVGQQMLFSVLLGLLLAASAIPGDMKNRRIVGILSKSVRRSEYLAGITLACWFAVLVYLIVVLAGTLALPRLHPIARDFALQLPVGALLGLLTATAAVMFSTFLHPFFATGAAVVLLSVPGAILEAAGKNPSIAAPGYELARRMFEGHFSRVPAPAVTFGLLECVLLFIIACLIFARRDVTTAAE